MYTSISSLRLKHSIFCNGVSLSNVITTHAYRYTKTQDVLLFNNMKTKNFRPFGKCSLYLLQLKTK